MADNLDNRATKDVLYAQTARIGKVLSSAKRLELLEILCQGEFTVEQLALEAAISVKLASAHLKELRFAQLVSVRRDGKYMFYSLADEGVGNLWVVLRKVAELRLGELRLALNSLVSRPDELTQLNGEQLLARAATGEVTVIDVRPSSEYEEAHFPHAISLPLSGLKQRLNEIPKDKPVIAYCRGPFCLMAKDAVALLRKNGIAATRCEEGVAEWRAHGMRLAR